MTSYPAHHIALWHPAVAQAIADLLTDDHHEPRTDGRGCGWCADEDWPCADRRARLAVARELTGESL